MPNTETPAAPRNTEEQQVRPGFTVFMLPALMFTVAAGQFGTKVIAESDAALWAGIVCKYLTAFAFFLCGVVRCFRIVEDYVTSRSNAPRLPPERSDGRQDAVVGTLNREGRK